MSSASMLELASVGRQDQDYVTNELGGRNLTFFRFNAMKHLPFSIEPLTETATGVVNFGSTSQFQVAKQADLMFAAFLQIDLPGISGATSAGGTVLEGVGEEPYWCQAVGQHLVEKVDLVIGGQTVDTLYSDWLFMHEELSGRPGRRLAEMTGSYDTVAQRQAQSRRSRRMYVPLPFFFSQNSGNALPIVSMQFSPVRFDVTWASRASCVSIPAGSSISSVSDVYVRTDGNTNAQESAATKTALADSDLTCSLLYFGVYLGESERAHFATNPFEQTVTQLQKHSSGSLDHSVSGAGESTAPKKMSERLLFNHRVVELVWAFRKVSNSTAPTNDHFNYGGHVDDNDLTGAHLDPAKTCTIRFNNSDRVKEQEGTFFRLVTPYLFHTSIPREFIYSYSFAMDPEDAQPTGGAPFSRIDNVHLLADLDARMFENDTVDLLCFAVNRNTIRYIYGQGSARWS